MVASSCEAVCGGITYVIEGCACRQLPYSREESDVSISYKNGITLCLLCTLHYNLCYKTIFALYVGMVQKDVLNRSRVADV